MKVKHTQKNEGFTLIELMIATALFVIIAVIALSAILSSNVAYKKTDDMRAITDNLTFALEDMSRNLKVGYNYSCDLSNGGALNDCPYEASDGDSGEPPSDSIGFVPFTVAIPAGDVNPSIMQGYVVCEESGFLSDGQTHIGSLFKITNDITGISGGSSCDAFNGLDNVVRLTDPRVHLSYQQSGFYVANTALDDNRQPYVTMVLVGETVTKDVVTPFTIQTSVTQRQFGK